MIGLIVHLEIHILVLTLSSNAAIVIIFSYTATKLPLSPPLALMESITDPSTLMVSSRFCEFSQMWQQ